MIKFMKWHFYNVGFLGAYRQRNHFKYISSRTAFIHTVRSSFRVCSLLPSFFFSVFLISSEIKFFKSKILQRIFTECDIWKHRRKLFNCCEKFFRIFFDQNYCWIIWILYKIKWQFRQPCNVPVPKLSESTAASLQVLCDCVCLSRDSDSGLSDSSELEKSIFSIISFSFVKFSSLIAVSIPGSCHGFSSKKTPSSDLPPAKSTSYLQQLQ